MTRYVPVGSQGDRSRIPPSAIDYRRRQAPIEPEDDYTVEADAQVPGRPTRKQQAVQQQQAIKSSQLPRVMDGYIGDSIHVKIINVVEVMKTFVWVFLFVVLIVAMVNVWFWVQSNAKAANYTYDTYRAQIKATDAPCKLDGLARVVTDKGTVIACDESSKIPTKAQINQWQGFLTWQACYQFGDQNECNQLND